MGDGDEIGKVTEMSGEARLEWCITDFLTLPKEVDTCFTSPYFPLSDTCWYLAIYPNGLRRHESEGWIGLYLHRGDSGSPKTIHYTLGIKRADGIVEEVFDEIVRIHRKGSGWGVPNFLPRLTLMRRMLELVPSNTLTVTCRLKSETPHLFQAGRFLSCASQTEVPNITVAREEGFALLSEHMKNLLINGTDHDVSINVKNKEFRAHKSILRARSPVFAKMLSHDMKENNTGAISIEDCDPDAFEDFLLYVYSGTTENAAPCTVINLYYAADKYDLPALKERCLNFLKTSLTKQVVCEVILLAAEHGEKELLDIATDFFIQNIEEILVTVEWQCFLTENPIKGNELYIKGLKSLIHKS